MCVYIKQVTVISKFCKLFNGFGFQHKKQNKYPNDHITSQEAQLIIHEKKKKKIPAANLEASLSITKICRALYFC